MSGIDPAELAVQRKNTLEFISRDPFPCTLIRTTKVSDGAGGYVDVPMEQPEQTLRLIPLQDRVTDRVLPDGRAVRPLYMLLGPHDANMERFDRFIKDGREYELVFLVENQQYQRKGEVAYVG